MENLHDFYLHFNVYTNEWNALLRNEANLYMNGSDKESTVFSDTSIDKLILKITSLQTHENV